ncbi:MAG: SDR family NAD(P)-dependent oxidoreductase [Deltaproteobacteria bacterium]|nr:SDR family NAD(P)-dependent oxidoreductase [Deltaproteobacteria bacterium]
MQSLRGQVAVVTGASRGIGKGVALGLGEAGATVYVTGRTVEPNSGPDGLPGSITETAAAVTALGGRGVPFYCDHRNDQETEVVFSRILGECSKIDVLVNAVWGGYERMVEGGAYTWNRPFWHQPYWRWDSMFAAGVRAHYVSSAIAARFMVARKTGLIVNISYWAGQKYMGNTAYGVAMAATDRLTAYTAHELRDFNVAVVALYPGLARTEAMLRFADKVDLSSSESPQFSGRAVVGMATDPKILDKTGRAFAVADLAREYGFADVDGKQPRPVQVADAWVIDPLATGR